MKIRHLTQSDYRVMPWKNHRGTTTEVFIFPENSSVQDDSYLWRVSSAAIASSCPFSQFLGFDRTVLLLEGESMALNHDCVDHPQVVKRMVPYRFKGEWQTTCEIADQAVQDFNLIVRRGKAVADLQVLQVTPLQTKIPVQSLQALIFCVSGELEISCLGSQKKLGHYESLLIEQDSLAEGESARSPEVLLMRALGDCAETILVQVNPKVI